MNTYERARINGLTEEIISGLADQLRRGYNAYTTQAIDVNIKQQPVDPYLVAEEVREHFVNLGFQVETRDESVGGVTFPVLKVSTRRKESKFRDFVRLVFNS